MIRQRLLDKAESRFFKTLQQWGMEESTDEVAREFILNINEPQGGSPYANALKIATE